MKLWVPKVEENGIDKVCLGPEPIWSCILTEEAQGGERTRLSLKAHTLVLMLSAIHHASLGKWVFSQSLCLLRSRGDGLDPSSL